MLYKNPLSSSSKIIILVLSCFLVAPRINAIEIENISSTRGVIEAIDRAILASGISSKIIHIGYRRGERFKKGDELIQFSCKRQKAITQSAKAAYNAALQNYQKEQELLDFNAAGKFDVEISKAEMEQALAQYNGERAVLDECSIKAPYDGVVVTNFINTHETPQAGQALIEIVNSEQVEVSMIVPSSLLQILKPGKTFSFVLDDLNQQTIARIKNIGAVVDPVSQTVEIISLVDNPDFVFRPGMGGTAHFEDSEKGSP